MTTPSDLELTERRQRVLRAVVEEYIATGNPVGSQTLARTGVFSTSASTLRYELAWLESVGLLGHPHTSAGRVPTEEGYRFYAEELLAERPAPARLAVDLHEVAGEIDDALSATTEALAQVTNLLALACAPTIAVADIRHVEIIALQPQVVMVVVITGSGSVAKRVFAFDAPVDPGLADWARAYLNESLSGGNQTLRSVRARLADPDLDPTERAFLAEVAPVFHDLFETGADRLYVGGASLLMSELRLQDQNDLGSLAAALEERAALLSHLRSMLANDGITVRLGGEHGDPALRPLAMITASYGSRRHVLGAVSVVGPLRMDYARAIGAVRGAAAALSDYVDDVYEG
jgi:heat-inducible transcriptional repressor